MSSDSLGTLMVVKQLCRNPNHPGLEKEKASSKEGGCIWLLQTKALALHNFFCCPMWTSHASLCTYYVTLNHSLPFQSVISFLSSNRLSALWGRENVTLTGPCSASSKVASLQRKMGLPLTEAEERNSLPLLQWKGTAEEMKGLENNGRISLWRK